jgi:thioredoxin reductase
VRHELWDAVIVGGGLACLSAAIYPIVDADMRTTVKGLYAARGVTSANCQMIITAGQGATAAQAIDRDLFDESLQQHRLPRMRTQEARVAGVSM